MDRIPIQAGSIEAEVKFTEEGLPVVELPCGYLVRSDELRQVTQADGDIIVGGATFHVRDGRAKSYAGDQAYVVEELEALADEAEAKAL